MGFISDIIGSTKSFFKLGNKTEIVSGNASNKVYCGDHDIDFRSPNANQALVFDGTKWRALTVSGGGQSGVSYISNKSAGDDTIYSSEYDSPEIFVESVNPITGTIKNSTVAGTFTTSGNPFDWWFEKTVTTSGVITEIEASSSESLYVTVEKNYNTVFTGYTDFSGKIDGLNIQFNSGDLIKIRFEYMSYDIVTLGYETDSDGWTLNGYNLPDYYYVPYTKVTYELSNFVINTIEKKANIDWVRIFSGIDSLSIGYYPKNKSALGLMKIENGISAELVYDTGNSTWHLISPVPKKTWVYNRTSFTFNVGYLYPFNNNAYLMRKSGNFDADIFTFPYGNNIYTTQLDGIYEFRINWNIYNMSGSDINYTMHFGPIINNTANPVMTRATCEPNKLQSLSINSSMYLKSGTQIEWYLEKNSSGNDNQSIYFEISYQGW